MKDNFKRFVFLMMVSAFLCLKTTNVLAAGDDPSVPIEADYDPDNEVPIDGGAGLIIAAGVAYGLKKIHDKRKKSSGGFE